MCRFINSLAENISVFDIIKVKYFTEILKSSTVLQSKWIIPVKGWTLFRQ